MAAPRRADSAKAAAVDPSAAVGRRVTPSDIWSAQLADMLGHVASAGRPPAALHGPWWWYEGADVSTVLDAGEQLYAFRLADTDGADAPPTGSVQMWVAVSSTQYPGKVDILTKAKAGVDPQQSQLPLPTTVDTLSPSLFLFQELPAASLATAGSWDRVLRCPSIEGAGFAVTPLALPPAATGGGGDPKDGPAWRQQQGGGRPSESTVWVPKVSLQVPGSRERFYVHVRYDRATGQLIATKVAWELPLEGVASMQDVFKPLGVHPGPRLLPASPAQSGIDAYWRERLAGGASSSVAMRYNWDAVDADGIIPLMRTDTEGASFLPAPGAPPTVELWFPGTPCYLRTPARLAPGAVVELGAVHGDGAVTRWVLRYEASGQLRLAEAVHETFKPPASQ